jgi:hypothetical protein
MEQAPRVAMMIFDVIMIRGSLALHCIASQLEVKWKWHIIHLHASSPTFTFIFTVTVSRDRRSCGVLVFGAGTRHFFCLSVE